MRNQPARGGNTKSVGKKMPLKGTKVAIPSVKENAKDPGLHKDKRA